MNNNILKRISMLLGILMITLLSLTINVQAQAVNYRLYNGLDYTYTSWGGAETQGTFGGTSRAGSYGSLDGNGGNTSNGSYSSSTGRNYNATYRSIDTGRIISKSQIRSIDFIPYTSNSNTRLYVADNDGVWYDTGLVVTTNGATMSIAGSSLPVANVRYMKGVSSSLTDGIQIVIHLNDTTAPTLTLTPSTTAQTNSSVTITAVGSDNVGVASIQTPDGNWTNTSSLNYTVSSNGTYNFAVKDTSGNVTNKSITISNIVQYNATISSSDIPVYMEAGRTYTAHITATNTGTLAWDGNYRLGAVNESDPFTGNRKYLPSGTTVAPGSSYTFELTLTAPTTTGTYTTDWRMVYEGVTWLGNSISYNVNVVKTTPSNLTTTPNPSGNSIGLSWTAPTVSPATSQNYSYRIYSKAQNESVFQTIPAKDNIRVLEIYPYTPLLRSWMNSYGLGKITVDSTPLETFNSTPSMINNYDVIVFGFSDSNSGKDISLAGEAQVESFIKSGKGVLLGHDTMRANSLTNFWKLAPLLNMGYDVSEPWYNGNDNNGHSIIKITKKGLLTNYPWNIGDVGTNLTVPYSHTVQQIPSGDVWMKYVDSQDTSLTKNGNFYLTTWNNVAMIQTGHSIGSGIDPSQYATPDEQKLIANTLFYLAQTTNATSWNDNKGQDLNAPNATAVTGVLFNNTNSTFTVNYNGVADNGTSYQYYIESSGSTTALRTQSSTQTATITTGVKGYAISIDQNPTATPSNEVKSTTTSYTFNKPYSGNFYVHIASIDNAGNMSSVTNYLVDNTSPTVSITPSTTAWTNGSVVLNVTSSDSNSGVKNIIKPDNTTVTGSTTTYTVNANGIYNFTVTDNVGNQTTKSITVSNIETSAPTLSLSPSTATWTNGSVVITANTSDDSSGIKSIILPNGNIVSGATTTTYTVSSNGNYTFKAIDNAGNTTEKSAYVNSIKTTTSELSVTPSTTAWTNQSVTLNSTFSDSLNTIKNIKTPDGTITRIHNKSPKILVMDYNTSSGNAQVGSRLKALGYDVTFDNTVTSLSQLAGYDIILADRWYWGISKATLLNQAYDAGYRILSQGNDTSNDIKIIKSTVSNTKSFAQQRTVVNEVTVSISTTNAGDTDTGQIITGISDDAVAWSTHTDYHGSAGIIYAHNSVEGKWIHVQPSMVGSNYDEFYMSAVDELMTGSKFTPTQFNKSYSVSSNGTYSFVLTDFAGNTSTKSVTVSNIDTVAPSLTLTQNSTAWTSNSVTISANASDSASGVVSITKPDGIVVNGSSANYTVSSNGIYTFSVKDLAGNITTQSITVSNIDTTAPTLNLSQSSTNWTNGTATINVNASDVGSGVKQITLPNGTIISGNTASYTVTDVGVYYFTVVDNVGNSTTAYIVIGNIDKNKPVTNITNNQNWSNASGVNVTISATDN